MRTVFDTEDQFSAEFHKEVRNQFPDTWRLCFHVPNEGKKTMAEAMKLKAMGVIAGVPDHLLVWNGKLYCFELKLPNGVVSKEQKDLHQRWAAQGVTIFICYDIETALKAVKIVLDRRILLGDIFKCKNNIITKL